MHCNDRDMEQVLTTKVLAYRGRVGRAKTC